MSDKHIVLLILAMGAVLMFGLLLFGCSTQADREFKCNLILDQQMTDNDETYYKSLYGN